MQYRAKRSVLTFTSLGFSARVLGALALLGCGDSSDGGPPPLEVEDMLGRTCMIDNASEVSCDEKPVPAAGCSAGQTACFTVGSTGDAAGPGAICAACCEGDTSRSTQADCSNIVCSTAEDCPAQYGRCVNSVCRH